MNKTILKINLVNKSNKQKKAANVMYVRYIRFKNQVCEKFDYNSSLSLSKICLHCLLHNLPKLCLYFYLIKVETESILQYLWNIKEKDKNLACTLC